MSEKDRVIRDIMNYMRANRCQSISRDVAREIVRHNIEMPSEEKLQDNHVSTKTSQILSTIRDDQGIRKVFSTGNGMFVFIERERQIEMFDSVLKGLHSRSIGLDRSIEKTENEKIEAQRQVTFTELLEKDGNID